MKIIYLASFKAHHPGWNMTYQDINGLRDIGGDMMEVDLDPYDVIIATPPCNYYSKLNRNRETSKYSTMTKHLLPEIIKKLEKIGKPYIVENVRSHIINDLIRSQTDFTGWIYQHGRHTYWTNVPFSPEGIKQKIDFKAVRSRVGVDKTSPDYNNVGLNVIAKNRQGGDNVHNVIEWWLRVVSGL